MNKMSTCISKIVERVAVVAMPIFTAVFLVMALVGNPAGATDISSEACNLNHNSAACQELNDGDRLPGIGQNIINTALYIVGILAVAMIIFAGLRYIMSGGNAKRVEQSKQILVYSVTGLIVALLAYAIVNFVLGKF